MAFKKLRKNISQRIEEKKIDIRANKAANKEIRKKARAAGLRERERQAIKNAERREKILAEQRLRAFKSKKLPPLRQTPSQAPSVKKSSKNKKKKSRSTRTYSSYTPTRRNPTFDDFASAIP